MGANMAQMSWLVEERAEFARFGMYGSLKLSFSPDRHGGSGDVGKRGFRARTSTIGQMPPWAVTGSENSPVPAVAAADERLILTGLGLLILLFAGDSLVKVAVNLSLRLGVPALIVSLTIVAFGTSAPELLIAIKAVWNTRYSAG